MVQRFSLLYNTFLQLVEQTVRGTELCLELEYLDGIDAFHVTFMYAVRSGCRAIMYLWNLSLRVFLCHILTRYKYI